MSAVINSNPFQPVTMAAPVAKVLVWAGWGVGKSHFMLTSPKPAVCDAENRIQLFSGRPEFGTIHANPAQDIDAIHAAISYLESGFKKIPIWDPLLKKNIERITPERIGVHDFETFALDGLTVIWEQRQFEQQLKIERSERQNKDTFVHADHGAMKRDYKSLMNRILMLPMNVCCTARLAEKRNDAGQVVSEKADVEKSTEYAFDLVIKLVPNPDSLAPDAVILKQSGNVYKVGDVIKNASWQTVVTPITARLQAARDAVAAHQQAIRELVATWRDAMTAQGKDQAAGDQAAKQIILRKTGRSSSSDLTMDEIATLRTLFTNPDTLKAELQS